MAAARPYSFVINSAATSVDCDLGDEAYDKVYLLIQDSWGSDITVQGSVDGENFYNISLSTSNAGNSGFVIPSSQVDSWIDLPLGFPSYRLVPDTAVTGTYSFILSCRHQGR